MQPLSPARNALFELSPAIPHKQTTLGTAPEIEDSTSTHASDSLRHRKAHPSQTRSWAVSKDAEGAFIQAEGCLERWAQAVFDEAQTYENEEYILRFTYHCRIARITDVCMSAGSFASAAGLDFPLLATAMAPAISARHIHRREPCSSKTEPR
jgi:hypothetical protein